MQDAIPKPIPAAAKYVVFDTESNGLFKYKDKEGNPVPADADGQPRLASVTFIITDDRGERLVGCTLYIQPDGWSMLDLGSEASEVNGLTDELLREKGVPVQEVLKVWNSFIDDGLIMAAYNAQHDMKHMRAELRRAGLPDRFEETPNTCLMRAMKAYKGQGIDLNNFGTCKLQVAAEYFGFTGFDWHNAEDDAEAARLVMTRLIEDGNLIEPKVHYAKKPPQAASEPVQSAKSPDPDTPTGTDLMLAPDTSLTTLFTQKDEDGNSILFSKIEDIERDVRAESYTVENKTGRDRIKSVAYKVARTKTVIDDAGKDLGEDARKTLDAINADRRAAKERLEALQAEVRKPLTEWETAEKERKERVDATLQVMEPKSVHSGMDVADIRQRMAEVEVIDVQADFWGDQRAEAELARSQCLAEWPDVLEAAEKRVAEAEELERLRRSEAERAEKDAQEARERDEQARRDQEAAEAAKRAEEAAQQRIEEIRRRLESEFYLADSVSGDMPPDILLGLLEQKRAIPIDDATWGNQMELAEAKKEAVVAKLEAFLKDAADRVAEEERKAAEDAEAEAKAHAEFGDDLRDAIIADIAHALGTCSDERDMAEAIYDGNIPHVGIQED